MKYFSEEILVNNILMKLDEMKITKKELSKELGMSMVSLNKALNKNDKTTFTFDQIVGISKFLNISVDSLLNYKKDSSIGLSSRIVAEFLVKLIENHAVKTSIINIKEEVYEYCKSKDEYLSSNREIEYISFYLPSYSSAGPVEVPFRDGVGICDVDAVWGNATPYCSVNDFLKKYLQIFRVYDKGELGEESYRMVVNDYLSRLS